MRAPFQEGAFTFPVKYGYCAVAERAEGPNAGEMVFALFPHQDMFRLPADNTIALPQGVPPSRAVLAANMETALNVVWDSAMSAGDRVAVIGAGVVGALVGYLAATMPGTDVTLCDSWTGARGVGRRAWAAILPRQTGYLRILTLIVMPHASGRWIGPCA